ncbi:MAG TPA: hypothetical protein VF255_03290 [Solirubrobacterales bacterium]
MTAEFEKLAYEAALRSLDKQEAYVEELRARTGVLLAASSLAASFLGQQAFQSPSPRGLVIVSLLAFVVSTGIDVFILMPKRDLVFAQKGEDLYQGLFIAQGDMPRVYRSLTHRLDGFWESNDTKIGWLIWSFAIAAVALTVEILALAALILGNILSS